jgi:sugar/nucleoside kinase (ribokinase family)
MTHDVACIGLTILDILGRPIDHIPEGGAVSLIDGIRLTVAGTAAGVAVNCAKLGLRTLLVGAIGDDGEGDFLLSLARRDGIDISAVQRAAGLATSATILTIRSNGDRPAFHRLGAANFLTLGPADYDRVLTAKFIHLGGVGGLPQLDGQPTADLLAAAKARGCTVTCDLVAPTMGTLDALKAALPHVDYFMPSLEEAAVICGRSEPAEVARFFLGLGAKACVFKCGAQGSYLAAPGREQRIPAFKVDVVDTTGWGDSYCAGFIAGLAQGWAVEKACRLATATAALVATGLGTDAGVVNLGQTIRAMETLVPLD